MTSPRFLPLRIIGWAISASFRAARGPERAFQNFPPRRDAAHQGAPGEGTTPADGLISAADRILSVKIAGRLLFRTRCLKRSLVLYGLLREHGYDPIVHVGIDRNDGRPLGHVWLSLDGKTIPEPPYAASHGGRFEEHYRIVNGAILPIRQSL